MRFTEVLKNKQLRGRLTNLIDYTYQWEEFDPVCPKEEELEIEKHKQRLNLLLDEIEVIMEHLGEISRECFEY